MHELFLVASPLEKRAPTPPSRKTAIRSLMPRISGSSEEIMTTAKPFRAKSDMKR